MTIIGWLYDKYNRLKHTYTAEGMEKEVEYDEKDKIPNDKRE